VSHRDEITLVAAKALHGRLTLGEFPRGEAQKIASIQVFLNELLDAEALSSSPPTADAKHNLDDQFSHDEERLLRKIDVLTAQTSTGFGSTSYDLNAHVVGHEYDQRWIEIARTHIQEGFSALRRAIYQPARVRLPEDVP
jgi:hypothetical protein